MPTDHSFRIPRPLVVLGSLVLAATLLPASAGAAQSPPVRFATFNASLNRTTAGQALTDLSSPGNAQANAVAEIIQRARPEVLLINEFDFYEDNALAEAFQENYLSIGQRGAQPIEYPYVFVAPSNTGIPSGHDLNNNGVVGGPDDAFGFGFPGSIRHGRLFTTPDRLRRDPHVPALPLEGHAGGDAPRRPVDARRAGRLVLGRGTRRLPPVEQEPLGCADRDWSEDGALPTADFDAARLRRAGGPQQYTELR